LTRKTENPLDTEVAGGGFLERWSRRKRDAAAETDAQAAATPVDAAITSEDSEDAPPELPDVESLKAGSDFRPFMRQGVPSATRTAALRKLWASNPLYNRIDMLDDYCEDYTDKAVVVSGLKTAYKIGRGLLDQADAALARVPETDGETPEDKAAPAGDAVPPRRTTT